MQACVVVLCTIELTACCCNRDYSIVKSNIKWCQNRDVTIFFQNPLKPLLELDFLMTGGTALPECWRQWKQTMKLFIELAMVGKSEKEKCSGFLYMIG